MLTIPKIRTRFSTFSFRTSGRFSFIFLEHSFSSSIGVLSGCGGLFTKNDINLFLKNLNISKSFGLSSKSYLNSAKASHTIDIKAFIKMITMITLNDTNINIPSSLSFCKMGFKLNFPRISSNEVDMDLIMLE